MKKGMKQLEREVIASMRLAIANFDTDSSAVRENYRKAEDLFDVHFMRWSDDFALLYNEMLKIYRSHSPKPTGHYRNGSIEVGYTGHTYQTWVKDKVQPPLPSSAELVAQFDKLVSEYTGEKREAV